jgi:hypothetical protein
MFDGATAETFQLRVAARSCAFWLLFLLGLFLCNLSGKSAAQSLQQMNPGLPKAGDHLWVDQFGLPSVDGSISCVVRFGSDLIVGGSFRQIGGVFANNIARWDGAGWHPLGNGLERTVTCLAV